MIVEYRLPLEMLVTRSAAAEKSIKESFDQGHDSAAETAMICNILLLCAATICERLEAIVGGM